MYLEHAGRVGGTEADTIDTFKMHLDKHMNRQVDHMQTVGLLRLA